MDATILQVLYLHVRIKDFTTSMSPLQLMVEKAMARFGLIL